MRPLYLSATVVVAGCASYSMFSDSRTGAYGNYPPDMNVLPEPLTEPEEPVDCAAAIPAPLYISPDDSNSMSSAVLARESVLGTFGSLTWIPIRTWEFLNYYTFAYEPAPHGELRVELDLVEDEVEHQYRLQIGIASAPATVEPMNLALVIDDSGSMNGAPLAAALDAARAIGAALREGDVVSLVEWSHTQDVLLEARRVSGPNDPVLLDKLDDIVSGGSTNLSAGLATGYELLERNFDPEIVNRLILISDGGANVGVTDEDRIGAAAGNEDEEGIYLVGVGVGTATSYHDLLMDTVTDLGKGASVFVPDAAEASLMFTERFDSTVGVAARDVHIRLDLPAGFSIVRTSAEEISTNPEAVRPQHVSPGDAMVLHQTLASACPDPALEEPVSVTVTWLDPITFEPRETSVTSTLGELMTQDHTLLRKGAAVVAYVDALKAEQDDTHPEALGAARQAVSDAQALAPDDADLAEIEDVLSAL